jgi:hemerythrin superfamily protein
MRPTPAVAPTTARDAGAVCVFGADADDTRHRRAFLEARSAPAFDQSGRGVALGGDGKVLVSKAFGFAATADGAPQPQALSVDGAVVSPIGNRCARRGGHGHGTCIAACGSPTRKECHMAATSARAKAATAPRAAPLTDAITLLTADHAEARQLFDRFDELCAEHADADSLQSLVENLCAVLTAHTMIEEEFFYPAARKSIENPGLLDQSAEDHARAKELIAQLVDASAGDALFNTRVRLLRDAIEQHVVQEEDRLFPQVRETRLDLQAMASKMAARKEEILEVKASEVVP